MKEQAASTELLKVCQVSFFKKLLALLTSESAMKTGFHWQI